MLNYSNPYDVLSETISFENVQLMGEMITLKTLRGRYAYSRQGLDWLYVGLVKDLNRSNDTEHVFSDAYDFVQNAVCFLCEFVGKKLTDVYTVKNGREITIKQATYSLVSRNIDRMSRHITRHCDINEYTEELSVEIDHYEEKDYTNYPEEKMCDYDRMAIWIRETGYEVKTTMEHLITMIFDFYLEHTEYDVEFDIEDCKNYVRDSGGLAEFDYEV